jgi:hypothetical protein
VRDALLRIAESHGARLRTGARVARVLLDPATGRAAGVELEGGERLEADVVVTNVDVAEALGLVTPPPAGEGGGGGSGAGAGGAAARGYEHAARRARRLQDSEYRWALARPSGFRRSRPCFKRAPSIHGPSRRSPCHQGAHPRPLPLPFPPPAPA